MKNKAQIASVFNIYTFIIMAFVSVIFFAGLIYVMGLLTTTFHTIGVQNEGNVGNPGYTNLTFAADATFGKVNDSIQALRLVAVVYIFGLGITIMLTGALQKINPIFFFAYVLIVFLGIMFAPTISNAYYSLLTGNIFDGTLASFTGANWLVLNLPLITAVIGILGGIFLFINLIRLGGDQIQ